MATATATEITPTLRIISFGYGHHPAPAAHVIADVRPWFRDPHLSPHLREKTGRDPEVILNVLSTTGVAQFIKHLFGTLGVLAERLEGPVTVAIGCVGGRHRSTVIATWLCALAETAHWNTELVHRDIDQPVLQRP